MADIRPFFCVRPKKELASEIAALPYDVYNRKEAYEYVKDKPISFLNIDRPETQFAQDVDMYSDEVYKKGRELFDDFLSSGKFIKDKEEAYYIYELVREGRSQSGIVAVASVNDYENNIIKKHENVTYSKLIDRIHHIKALDAQTGPIFLAHRRNKELQNIVDDIKKEKPLYSFVSDDNITHNVWKSTKYNVEIENIFKNENKIYIADGHHRCASACEVAKTKDKKAQYFLSVIFDANELFIMPCNRVVKTLNGRSVDDFLKELSLIFDCEKIENIHHTLQNIQKAEYGMYLDGKWYLLKYKLPLDNDAVNSLDVSILQNKVLAPLLNIADPKIDKNISFIGGIRGYEELERLVDSKKYEVAFFLHATSIDELIQVSDENRLMPPKSTWFEPKLRSGIFIHQI